MRFTTTLIAVLTLALAACADCGGVPLPSVGDVLSNLHRNDTKASIGPYYIVAVKGCSVGIKRDLDHESVTWIDWRNVTSYSTK